MDHVKKIITNTVFVVQILIAFILVFESSIHVPPVFQAIGRLHPFMPPKDKAQLSEEEIYFISHWIDAVEDTDIKLNELAQDDTLKTLASEIIPRYQRQDDTPLFAFNFVSPEKIEKLSRPN